MARRALTRPGPVFNTEYQNYLVSEIEYRDGLTFKKESVLKQMAQIKLS